MEREEMAKFIDNRITNYIRKINQTIDKKKRDELLIRANELVNLFDDLGFKSGEGIVDGKKRHVIINTRIRKAVIC